MRAKAEPPYYAVIFSSERAGSDPEYERTADRMVELARQQPGELAEPPYYAVIFSSERAGSDPEYERTADRMVELARQQPGFLDIETARGGDGVGITVSYWKTLEDIAAWKSQVEHLEAQKRGRDEWYSRYVVRVARVERAYDFSTRD